MSLDLPTIALPFALVWLLTLGMQYLKQYVLEPLAPGFSPSDTNHDRNIRILYGVLAFAAILAYALLTLPQPATIDGWLSFVAGIVVASQGVTGIGHITYKTLNGTGGGTPPQPATPADVPPGAPSVAALGLPTTEAA